MDFFHELQQESKYKSLKIYHATNGGEVELKVPGHHYFADGYFVQIVDEVTREHHIVEFLGDMFHGNLEKFVISKKTKILLTQDQMNKSPYFAKKKKNGMQKTYRDLYIETYERLENIFQTEKYHVHFIWESDWKFYLYRKKSGEFEFVSDYLHDYNQDTLIQAIQKLNNLLDH